MPDFTPPSPAAVSPVPAGVPLSSASWSLLPAAEREALSAFLLAQQARIEALEVAVRELTAKLNSNSSNSSRPPSSDGPQVKRSPNRRRGGKKGAQFGHKGTRRAMVPPEEVSAVVERYPERCRDCGGALSGLEPVGAPQVSQVFEVPEIRPEVTELRLHAVRCTCGCITVAEAPPELRLGVGVRALALVALLVGRFRLSRSQVAELFSEQWGIPLSKGSVQAACETVSAALEAPVNQVREALPKSGALFIDETGWKAAGARRWLWVFVATTFTVFVVNARRGRQVLEDLGLDLWRGFLHSDRWSAYNNHPDDLRQLCWAHLMRDLQAIVDADGPGKEPAARALEGAHGMFHEWHLRKDGEITHAEFALRNAAFQSDFRSFCQQGAAQDDDRRWRALGRELLKHWPAVFRFVEIDGLEPTNNAAERALRPAVIWRRLTQGTRSEKGSNFVARILTTLASCGQQRRNPQSYIEAALRAHLNGVPPPTLLNNAT